MWYVSPKRRLTFNGLHSVISQKIVLFMTTAVRTSNPSLHLVRKAKQVMFRERVLLYCLTRMKHSDLVATFQSFDAKAGGTYTRESQEVGYKWKYNSCNGRNRFYYSLSSRHACACLEASFSSQNGDGARGVIWEVVIVWGRSQWPCGLRHELSSLAQMLGLWVRIPFKAWISVCVCSVFVCCPVCR
jgi:hypothetical protein